MSSVAHRYGTIDFDDLNWKTRRYKKNSSYGQSKLANLLFSLELSDRVAEAGKGPMVLSAHPGWTATDLQRYNTTARRLNPFMEMRGYPVQVGTTKEAKDRAVARRLWEVSEELTGVQFGVQGSEMG